ncbi:hypothetical protein OC846_002250 [Tilletia horrida]|uniref:Uncharacterized protein n=1 Tax=Tilletia horrida TaxID=155126 RepID=A0AAN6GTY7_9BASI|nr:hypothetical protein OC845_004887 [Tilletia horrida]KAK0554029.1 hypothetical protein OC846_002250 [Tilletia horrida]
MLLFEEALRFALAGSVRTIQSGSATARRLTIELLHRHGEDFRQPFPFPTADSLLDQSTILATAERFYGRTSDQKRSKRSTGSQGRGASSLGRACQAQAVSQQQLCGDDDPSRTEGPVPRRTCQADALFERRQYFAVLAGSVLDHEAELVEETKAYGGDTSDENEAKEDADRTDTLAYQLKAHLPRSSKCVCSSSGSSNLSARHEPAPTTLFDLFISPITVHTLAHVFEDVTYEIKDLRKNTMSKPHWDRQRRQERDDAFNTVFDTSHKAFGDNNW